MQTGHSTCTCTVTLRVIEQRTLESFKKNKIPRGRKSKSNLPINSKNPRNRPKLCSAAWYHRTWTGSRWMFEEMGKALQLALLPKAFFSHSTGMADRIVPLNDTSKNTSPARNRQSLAPFEDTTTPQTQTPQLPAHNGPPISSKVLGGVPLSLCKQPKTGPLANKCVLRPCRKW